MIFICYWMLSYESKLSSLVCSLAAFLLPAQDAAAMKAQRDRPAAAGVASSNTNAAGFTEFSPLQTCSIDGHHGKLPRTCLSSTTTSQIGVARPMCLLSVSVSILERMGETPPRRAEKPCRAAALLSAHVPFLRICIQVQWQAGE